MTWKAVKNIEDLKKGDKVRGTNFTHSQKYFEIPGLEEYNRTREGLIVNDNFNDFFEVEIKTEEGLRMLVYNCGTSGDYFVEKWITTNS